jgi:hypothetical protein
VVVVAVVVVAVVGCRGWGHVREHCVDWGGGGRVTTAALGEVQPSGSGVRTQPCG